MSAKEWHQFNDWLCVLDRGTLIRHEGHNLSGLRRLPYQGMLVLKLHLICKCQCGLQALPATWFHRGSLSHLHWHIGAQLLDEPQGLSLLHLITLQAAPNRTSRQLLCELEQHSW